MEIRPILSTLRRHKTAAALIVLQVAVTCAIICNAVFLIAGRLEAVNRPTGIDEAGMVRIQLTGIGQDANPMVATREDLAALRAIPGVIQAASVNQVPLVSSSWNTSIGTAPGQVQPTLNATMYMGGPELFETMGLQLVAGRAMAADEFQDYDQEEGFRGITPSTAVVTRAFAERVFPDSDGFGVGETFYFGEDPVRIVGVVDTLLRPNFSSISDDPGYSMVLPVAVPYTLGGNYLIRTTPERRAEVLEAAVRTLKERGGSRIILEQQTYDEMRDDYFAQDRAMAWLLLAVILALLVVTALGIVGLASFWVQQRTKQIGVRRALGATRGQILRYFQTENFILATAGIVIGMVLAFGLNQLLMERYELARLPLVYLPVGAVALWLLGQFAVFWPARRAAAVPPAVATRSV
ncbi:ABC transporter permease [Luteimonas sp. SJ-92]|uniref:ABC transporter permease n=1 Tax=Luteimonas salinisoli TaxID=2752307 RepID=A0A853J8R1_9GAMM|nr:FtsX-like permease family protein [Luteimonas salinisoli]NZA25576.1 ABC transporter permease [Luteimonas salinisoli]